MMPGIGCPVCVPFKIVCSLNWPILFVLVFGLSFLILPGDLTIIDRFLPYLELRSVLITICF